MKKIFYILTILLFTTSLVNAQKMCCPEFSLQTNMKPCYKEVYVGGTSPIQQEYCQSEYSACKHTKQNYVAFPIKTGFTYTWTVTGGTPSSTSGNPIDITWDNGKEGTIKVEISNQDGSCKDVIYEKICLKDAPTANFSFSPSSPICLNQNVQFSNSSVGATTNTWDFGDGFTSSAINPNHTYTTPGTYTITLTVSNGKPINIGPTGDSDIDDICGCFDTITKTIVVKGESGITIIPDCKQMLCKGDKSSYSTTSQCNNYNWSVTGGHIEGASNTPTINVIWDGSYPATVTLAGTCGGTCGNVGTLNVPVLYPTMAVSGANVVCPSDFTSYSLPSMPGTNYAWTISGGGTISGFTTDTSVINVQWGTTASTTPYTITCNYTNPITKCSGKGTISVKVLPRYIISGPTKFCVDDTFNFSANGAGSWSISPTTGHTPSTFSSGTSISGAWTKPGKYTITATPTTPSDYCSSPATLEVTVYAKPILNAIVGPAKICPGKPYLYTISSNMTDGLFNWTPTNGIITAYTGNQHESVMITWNATGSYGISVTQTVENCTSQPKTLTVTPYPKPTITGSLNTCMDTEITYTASGDAPVGGYVWTMNNALGTIKSGQGTNTIKVLWHGSTSITSCLLMVTTCGGTDSVTVNVSVAPPLTISRTNSLCSPTGITLSSSISGATSYVWTGGTTTPNNTQNVTVTSEGTYTLTVTSANGCKSKSSITIPKENLNVIASLSTPNKTFWECTETIATNLVATTNIGSGYCYQWYTNSTGASLGAPISGATTATYLATTTGYFWCEVSICGTSCRAETNKIKIVKYSCGGVNDCNPNYTTNINVTGCNPKTITGSTTPAAAAGTIHWYFGDGDEGTGTSVTHTYKYIGDFNVCAEFGASPYCRKNQCKIVSVTLAANFKPTVNCDTVSLVNLSQVKSPSTITHLWSFPGGSPSSSTATNPPNVVYATGGNHTISLTVEDNTGCKVTYSEVVKTTSLDATITIPTPICAKSIATFSASSSNPDLSYQWNFGDGFISNLKDTDHTYAVSGVKNVTLIITDKNGCSKSISQTITVSPEIVASIGSDKKLCAGEKVKLSVSTTFLTYQWYQDGIAISGATNATYDTGSVGEYWVVVSNGVNCSTTSNHINVTLNSSPIANIKGKTIQCKDNGAMSVRNYVSEVGTTYLWTVTGPGAATFSPNNTVYNPMINATVPGDYQIELTATNAGGCKSKDNLCITLVKSPTVTVTGPTGEMCEGKSYTFTATSSEDCFFTWSNGATGPTMTTGLAGMYIVKAINKSGCDAMNIAGTIKSLPDISLFPKGCSTACWTDTINFPLPKPTSGAYTVTWYDDDGTAVANVGSSQSLALSTLQPGIHHLHATVSLAGGCIATTGVLDLNIKDCTLLPECDNCKDLLTTTKAEADSHLTNTATAQISSETITFTILKPIKEVRISLADLKYSWKDPACANCKVQMLERGCLFAESTNQPVGTLNPASATATNTFSNSTKENCQDELIWNDGKPLQPGTYTIPIQLSLPKGAKENCTLILEKACFHLTLIDEDCKRCEKIFCKKDAYENPNDCACNAGNNWTNLYLKPSKPGIAKPQNQIICNTTLTDIAWNEPYTLSGVYMCKGKCAATKNEITVYNQVNQIIYTHVATTLYETITFPEKGMYSVTLTATCGDQKCTCSFRINVDKGLDGDGIPNGEGNPTDNGDPKNPEDPKKPIDEIVKEILPPDFNGGVLVSKNDEILFEKYYSFKDNVTSHTAFDLASVTKTFTSMAILKLMENGKLNVDDAVVKYLPDFTIPEITIKMLLSHKSGLEDYLKFMDESSWDKSKNMTNADLYQFIIKNKSKVLINTPGKTFDYSNTNYALLALIIEKITGESYKEYLSKTFFKPLQMNDTYVMGLDNYAGATKSYYKNGKVYSLRYLDLIYGDKNVYSTVQDLKKWDKALRGGQLFKKSTLDLAYAPTSKLTPFSSNYGLGWKKIVTTKGNEIIYHTGWWAGNRSLLIRLVKENVMIAVVSNNNFSNISDIRKLCDLFGDYEQKDKKIENF